MPAAETDPSAREVTGIIQHVDVPRREVTLLVDGTSWVFDVAHDCCCQLHGERVKLRLLLPMDYARVLYTEAQGVRTARAVSVHWWLPFTGEVRQARSVRQTGFTDGSG